MTGDTTIDTGRLAEELSAQFLTRKGLQIIDRNFRSKAGEIDLIALDGITTVFVEVRYRSNRCFGTPAETVNWKKQKKLLATAHYFLQQNRLAADKPSRFDVIAVTKGQASPQIEWIQNAFGDFR